MPLVVLDDVGQCVEDAVWLDYVRFVCMYQDKYVVTSIFIIEIISKHLFGTLRNMASSVVKLR